MAIAVFSKTSLWRVYRDSLSTAKKAGQVVDQSLRQSDTIALLTYGLVVSALAGGADGVNTADEYVAVATNLRDLRAGEQIIRLNGEGDYAELVEALFASEHIQVFPELVESGLGNGAPAGRGPGIPERVELHGCAGGDGEFTLAEDRDGGCGGAAGGSGASS